MGLIDIVQIQAFIYLAYPFNIIFLLKISYFPFDLKKNSRFFCSVLFIKIKMFGDGIGKINIVV